MTLSLTLTDKQARVVNRCLRELFSGKSLEPITWERLRELKFPEELRRRVKVAPNGNEALMSDTAAAAFERLIATLAEAGANDDRFTLNDLAEAVRRVYEGCWQRREEPEDAWEIAQLVAGQIDQKVKRQTIVAALHGVKLSGVDEMRLGELRLVASLRKLVDEAGVATDDMLDGAMTKELLRVPCLVGTNEGTLDGVKRWYGEQAHLAAGMLAVEAGALYEQAATSFCIEPGFEQPSGGAPSAYVFWSEAEKSMGCSISAGRGQQLDLTTDRVTELSQPGAFEYAFRLLQRREQTALEDAITRAVYWYGDGHRDPIRVMQFVKYWACLECLLGGPGEKLTETLAMGVAAVLTFGHFRLLKQSDWPQSVKIVKRLYALRSRAVHRASHAHITFPDLVVMSQWTAWVIYNAVSFSHAGMRTPQTLWTRVQEVARHHAGAAPCEPDRGSAA